MYGTLMMLITALCAAFAVGCLVLLVGRFLLEIDLSEKVERMPRRLPILIRLLLPFITVTRPLASGAGLAGWRDLVAPKLWMAGLGEMLSPVDFVALRLVFLLVALLLLGFGLLAGYFWGWALLALLIALFPGFWLSSEIKRRHLSIMKALPNVLDLLTLSVESGRDLLSAPARHSRPAQTRSARGGAAADVSGDSVRAEADRCAPGAGAAGSADRSHGGAEFDHPGGGARRFDRADPPDSERHAAE